MVEEIGGKYEWGTLEWLAMYRRILQDAVTPEQLAGCSLVNWIEYTAPPSHLLRDGRKTVGWHIRIENGVLNVFDGPLPASESDVQHVGDYAVNHAIRLMQPYSDEQKQAQAKAIADGTLKITGNLARMAAIIPKTPLPGTAYAITAATC